MPELPEVETLRRQLEPRLAGRRLEQVAIADSRWCAPGDPSEIERELTGARVVGVRRRGKYFVVELAREGLERSYPGAQRPRTPAAHGGPSLRGHEIVVRGEPKASRRMLKRPPDGGCSLFLVMHLRMTGNLLWRAAGSKRAAPGPQPARVSFTFDDGSRLDFVDVRRFGTGVLVRGREELDDYFGVRLGPEPLAPGFDRAALQAVVSDRKAPIKSVLLDQRRVAGIGNIYADEALFRARIHPARAAGRLRVPEVERLLEGIVSSLRKGIERQGASIDDYRHYNGESGRMQDEFLVHRREGEPCPRCGHPIEKARVGGRASYFCRRCQPVPRKRRTSPRRRRGRA